MNIYGSLKKKKKWKKLLVRFLSSRNNIPLILDNVAFVSYKTKKK